MTATTQTPIIHKPKTWTLQDLEDVVIDFFNSAKRGQAWDDADIAHAGRYNYPKISDFVFIQYTSEKYRGFVSLYYLEKVDGDKEESVTLAYYSEYNGEELGRIKIKQI